MNQFYELPWSEKNNPNGWIEPTTYCQLKCPGCYRGLAQINPLREHKSLSSLILDVDWFKTNRNVQTISIAGGEPLCYPQLDDLISYITSQGIKTKVFTNGILVTAKRLQELKNAGVTEIVVHVDKLQKIGTSEIELNDVRLRFCNMFREIGGVNLGFIMPLSSENLVDLPVLADFFKENADIVNLVVFTIFKNMLPTEDVNAYVSMEQVQMAIKSAFGISFCAYLSKTHSKNAAWLFSLSAYAKGNLLGSFDSDFYKLIHKRYMQKKKKYFITIKNRSLSIANLMVWSLNPSVRRVIMQAFKNKSARVNTQVVLIIDPPSKVGQQWDLCQGCPDAMLYNDHLVPSCLLERIKSGERI